jgi:hypothetical protein
MPISIWTGKGMRNLDLDILAMMIAPINFVEMRLTAGFRPGDGRQFRGASCMPECWWRARQTAESPSGGERLAGLQAPAAPRQTDDRCYRSARAAAFMVSVNRP